MAEMRFLLNTPIEMEECLTCEFKEVRGANPAKDIAEKIEEYVVAYLNAKGGSVYWGVRDSDRTVAGVHIEYSQRDALRQTVANKINAVEPMVLPGQFDLPFHSVYASSDDAAPVPDKYVVEARIYPPSGKKLYLTAQGTAYVKTVGGKQKLTGSQLMEMLLEMLKEKAAERTGGTEAADALDFHGTVPNRAQVAAPLIRGGRILWVDDNHSSTIYERRYLSSLGVAVDTARSTDEALMWLKGTRCDLVVSDIAREGNPSAGLDLLKAMSTRENAPPIIYYVGRMDRAKGTPPGAFGITNRPDEIIHLIFDVLERR